MTTYIHFIAYLLNFFSVKTLEARLSLKPRETRSVQKYVQYK